MILYIEKITRGMQGNVTFYTGIEGFYNMGFEIVEVKNINDLQIEEDNVFLGSIKFIQSALQKMNIEIPKMIDYPTCLKKYYGRQITESTIEIIANNPNLWNVFVKPKDTLKKFTGRHIKSTKDLIGCGDRQNSVPVWVSEPVDFVREWRVFVRYNTILDIRPYVGDWQYQYDYKIIEAAVKDYKNAPAGYAIDFGLTRDGRLLIVEVNEGYSLGSYGLFYIDYAKLIAARWAEMTNQKDLCNF
ncbi:MAG: DUF4343 domain-containing protein [Cytophagia bacterium]|nr:MAG: DUF4343 domain-containing protein [Cytophagia bacterium]TAG37849.1 MAG: DUF4343 domain-containing protein [Cytophagia bacterium]